MRRRFRAALTVGIAVSLATTVAACSAGGSSATASSGAGSSGSSIKVLAMGQYQATEFSLPEMQDAVEAAINAANKSGGINGAKIQLTTCNDQGDPNVAAACARQAISEGAVAVLGSISLYDASVNPLLQAANIPLIGNLPLGASDYTSSISYPIDSGNPGNFASEGPALIQRGCTKVGVVYDASNSAGQNTKQLIVAGVTSHNGQVVSTVGIPATSPDLSSYVSVLLQAGAKCLAVGLPPATQTKFIIAVRQSSDPNMPMAATFGSAPLTSIDADKAAFQGVLLPAACLVPSKSTTPMFLSQLAAQNPKAPASNPAEIAWSAATAFVDVARQIKGPVTARSVIAQLGQTSALKLETYPAPIDFSKQNPDPAYSRLFNTSAVLYEVENGNYVEAQAKPIDIEAALKQ